MSASEVHPNDANMAWVDDSDLQDGEGAEGGEEDENFASDDNTSSLEEEQDKREYGIHQCLPVDEGEPNWDEGEPQSVEEYIRRVRHEARQLPDVVTVPPPGRQQHAADAPHSQQDEQQQRRQEQVQSRQHYSSRYLEADPGVQACDAALKPSAAWCTDFLVQFAALRRRLQREVELTSGQAAGEAVSGSGVRLTPHQVSGGGRGGGLEAAAELEALALDSPSACMPELQQLQGLDQLQVRRQLHSAIREAVQQEQVAPDAAAQLYALSARIEKPLHAGTCALYRQLLRLCAAQRAALGGAGTCDSQAATSHPLLPHLNILITLAGAFFGQDEELAGMWEDNEQ